MPDPALLKRGRAGGKPACNQAGFAVASGAIQVMGGAGFSEGTLAGCCMRRCRGWMTVGERIGTTNIRLARAMSDRCLPQRAAVGPAAAVAAG